MSHIDSCFNRERALHLGSGGSAPWTDLAVWA